MTHSIGCFLWPYIGFSNRYKFLYQGLLVVAINKGCNSRNQVTLEQDARRSVHASGQRIIDARNRPDTPHPPTYHHVLPWTRKRSTNLLAYVLQIYVHASMVCTYVRMRVCAYMRIRYTNLYPPTANYVPIPVRCRTGVRNPVTGECKLSQGTLRDCFTGHGA
jgi:hypothetical protein